MNYYDRLVDLLLEQRLMEEKGVLYADDLLKYIKGSPRVASGGTRAAIKHLRGLKKSQKERGKVVGHRDDAPLLIPGSEESKASTRSYRGVMRALPAVPGAKAKFHPGSGVTTTHDERVRALMQRASRYSTRPRGRSST